MVEMMMDDGGKRMCGDQGQKETEVSGDYRSR